VLGVEDGRGAQVPDLGAGMTRRQLMDRHAPVLGVYQVSNRPGEANQLCTTLHPHLPCTP
jgi:hypothetical protein